MKEENNNKSNFNDVVFTYNENEPNYNNIRFAFDRLIGPLATATAYEQFKDRKKDYSEILPIIIKWSAEFETKKTLVYINHNELLAVYNKLEELNDELVCEVDSEISDQIIIWLWNLMILRKKQIENLEGEKKQYEQNI